MVDDGVELLRIRYRRLWSVGLAFNSPRGESILDREFCHRSMDDHAGDAFDGFEQRGRVLPVHHGGFPHRILSVLQPSSRQMGTKVGRSPRSIGLMPKIQ